MKIFTAFLSSVLLVFAVAKTSNATLVDQGGGLIYDSELNITWLQNANYAASELTDARVEDIITAVNAASPTWLGAHTLTTSDFWDYGTGSYLGLMTWWGAMAWADQLVYGGYDDWRLASMDVNRDGTVVDCSSVSESEAKDNEYGYMYYYNLGGNPGDDLTGDQTVNGVTLNSIGGANWSDTEDANFADNAWRFQFFFGGNYAYFKDFDNVAWAVRPGDSPPVPEPATVLLLGTGLLGFAGARLRRGFKK